MNPKHAAPGRPAYLAWLPRFLFETDPVPPRYLAKAWLTALLPSIALSALVRFLAADAAAPQFPGRSRLAGAVRRLGRTGPRDPASGRASARFEPRLGPGPAAIGSALIWGVVHSLVVPIWGLVIWWPFLVMSVAFLTWRSQGLLWALGIAFAIHALQNGFAVGLILLAK